MMSGQRWSDPRTARCSTSRHPRPRTSGSTAFCWWSTGASARSRSTLPEIDGVKRFVSLWSSADEAPRDDQQVFAPGTRSSSAAPRCICSARNDTPEGARARLTVAALRGTVGSERGHVEARLAVPSSPGVSCLAELDPPFRCARRRPRQPDHETVTGRIPLALPSPVTRRCVPAEGLRRRGRPVPHDRIPRGARSRSACMCACSHPRATSPCTGCLRCTTASTAGRRSISPLEEGIWSFRFEAFGDDFATWEHAADLKIRRGRLDAHARDGSAAVRACRPPEGATACSARVLTNAAARLRDSAVSDAAALEIVRDHAIAEYFADRPLASLGDSGRDARAAGRAPTGRVGAWYEFFPRSEGAKAAEGRHDQERHLPHRGQAHPCRRRHGIRGALPPSDPPDRRLNRKGRNNSLRPAARRPGSRGPSARPRAVTTPSIPTSARWRIPRLRRRHAKAEGMEVALDLALQAAPDHPGWPSIPSGSPPCPTAPSPMRRIRRRSTRTSIRSTSTTTRGDQRRSAPHRPPLDGPGCEDLPRRQPAHQAAPVLGMADRRA